MQSRAMKIRKGDTVVVIAGNDKGKQGEIKEVLGAENRVVVAGINLRWKHKKPTQRNPKGERAADSLYYLGQSLMKLDQSSQACKAYGELEAVYGSTMRVDLKKLLSEAKSQAKCRA